MTIHWIVACYVLGDYEEAWKWIARASASEAVRNPFSAPDVVLFRAFYVAVRLEQRVAGVGVWATRRELLHCVRWYRRCAGKSPDHSHSLRSWPLSMRPYGAATAWRSGCSVARRRRSGREIPQK